MQFGINLLGFAFNRHKQVQLAGSATHFGNVDRDKTYGVVFAYLLGCLVFRFVLGQTGQSVVLQAAVQVGAAEFGNIGFEQNVAFIQRQTQVAAYSADGLLF